MTDTVPPTAGEQTRPSGGAELPSQYLPASVEAPLYERWVRSGYFTADQLRSHYASGISRVLQNNKPRRDQAYNTMQLMQWNWFLDKGVLRFDPATSKLSIDYERYPAAVESLLKEVLAIQDAGDPKRADAFITRWATWDENLHGKIAANIREQQRYRYRLITYAALGE